MSVPAVLAAIRQAEAACGRTAGEVRLVAVTKSHELPEIQEKVLQYGPFPLAENKGQELRDKVARLADTQQPSSEWPSLEWHFIGPLQRNKIKYLQPVTLIHTIEEVWQAQALADAASKWGHAPDLLLQMHNGEEQKHGVAPDRLADTLQAVQATGLKVRGLMVMAPYGQPAAASRLFQDTARRAHDLGLNELSMGMSDDFPLAIAAGATLVRVGRSLFV